MTKEMTSIESQSANLYHKNSSSQAQQGHNLLSKVQVHTGSLVLDLGCGTEYLATVLSEMVGPEGRVVAVDPDAERIKIAKEMNARHNIEYLVEDDQSFQGVGYTLIFSNQVIHWIENKEALFARLYDKLAAGGHFSFVTLDSIPEFPPTYKRALNVFVSQDFIDHFIENIGNATDYQRMAESVGFEVTSTTVETKYKQWTSVDELINYCAGISQGDVDVDSIDQKNASQHTVYGTNKGIDVDDIVCTIITLSFTETYRVSFQCACAYAER